MNIYEHHGRLLEQHADEVARHRRTIEVLGQVVRGEIELSRLEVGTDSWKLLPEVPKPDDE